MSLEKSLDAARGLDSWLNERPILKWIVLIPFLPLLIIIIPYELIDARRALKWEHKVNKMDMNFKNYWAIFKRKF